MILITLNTEAMERHCQHVTSTHTHTHHESLQELSESVDISVYACAAASVCTFITCDYFWKGGGDAV